MSPETPLLYKFREMGRRTRIGTLDAGEAAELARMAERSEAVPAGTELIGQGEPLTSAVLLLEGWAARSVSLDDGRRQILNYSLPGDVVGVHVPVRPMAYFTMTALTELRVRRITIAELERLQAGYPRLNALLNWACDREAHILAEQIVRLGRRPAAQRLASLLLELRLRLLGAGAGETEASTMPLTQALLADTLGLSPVHINRVLRSLAAAGYVWVKRGRVGIRDADGLTRFCRYDALLFEQAPYF